MDILTRLETANEYCETSEARQLRKDAAEEIRRLRHALVDATEHAQLQALADAARRVS